MIRVVFICTANICRSPMAEGILRQKWKDLGRTDLEVTSMGISEMENKPANESSQQICLKNGIDISQHRSRFLETNELAAANIILTMDLIQKKHVQLFFPIFHDKINLLGAWLDQETKKSVIKDPIGCRMAVFTKVFDKINYHIDRIIPTLQLMTEREP